MNQTRPADFFMAYTAYNLLGSSVLVGLLRTITATVNLAKLYFNQESYATFKKREQESAPKKRSYKAEDLGSHDRSRRRLGEDGSHDVASTTTTPGGIFSRFFPPEARVNSRSEPTPGLDQLRRQWKEQLYRGLEEMIPLIGSAYCTYQDFNRAKEIGNVDLLGLSELGQLVQTQISFNSKVFAK